MPSFQDIGGRLVESREAQCWECGEDFETFDETIPNGGIGRCDDCADSEYYDEVYERNQNRKAA